MDSRHQVKIELPCFNKEDERDLTRMSERKKKKEEEEENKWNRCLCPNKLCWKLEMEGTVSLACPFQQE
jgi:hypothetical protein